MNKRQIQKIAWLLILVMMLPMQMIYPMAASAREQDTVQNTVLYGDVNEDQVVNASDALAVLQHAAGITEIEEGAIVAADVNGDRIVNAEDALLILQKAAGLLDVFPVEDMPEPTPEPTPDPNNPDGFSGTVYIVGDSIAAYHAKDGYERPLYGWGEVIGDFYTEDVTFVNKAVSSMSSSSYYLLKGTTYQKVFDGLTTGDYIIISFGHNDHNATPMGNVDRRTDPEASSSTERSYKWWLKKYYIDPALAKGATPILMSSVVRCTYKSGKFTEESIHLKYGKAMEELVEEYVKQGITIPFIDAQQYTYQLYSSLSETEAKRYHGLGQPSWGQWYFDNTHYSYEGATMISRYISSELAKLPMGINQYLKMEER